MEVPLNLELLLPRALFSFGKNGCSFYILFLSVRNAILYRKKVVVVMVGMVVNRAEREEGHAGKSERKDQSKVVKVAAKKLFVCELCLCLSPFFLFMSASRSWEEKVTKIGKC